MGDFVFFSATFFFPLSLSLGGKKCGRFVFLGNDIGGLDDSFFSSAVLGFAPSDRVGAK